MEALWRVRASLELHFCNSGDLARINGVLGAEKYRQTVIHQAKIPKILASGVFCSRTTTMPRSLETIFTLKKEQFLEFPLRAPPNMMECVYIPRKKQGLEEPRVHGSSVVSSPGCWERPATNRPRSSTVDAALICRGQHQ